MMMKLEGFRFDPALDLNTEYYTLRWGNYKYKRLPMNMSCSLDMFQYKMLELFKGLEYVRTYIDYFLYLAKFSLIYHLNNLETI